MLPLNASHLDLCASISGGRVVALLCLHLSVRLDVDVLVGREGGDHVVGDLGAVMCQYHCGEVWVLRHVPEALDQSELVGDLAALVGDVLLCLVELLLGSGVLEGDLDSLAWYRLQCIWKDSP